MKPPPSGKFDLPFQRIQKWQTELLGEYSSGRALRFLKITDQLDMAFSQEPKLPRGVHTYAPKCHGLLPSIRAIVVGLDIREYSRRSPEQQLFLTVSLHANIELAIEQLHRSTLVQHPEPRITIQTGDGAFIVFTYLDSRQQETIYEIGSTLQERINDRFGDKKAGSDFLKGDQSLEKLLPDSVPLIKEIRQLQKEETEENLPKIAGEAMSFVFTLNSIICRNNRAQRYIASGDDEKKFRTFPVECRYAVSYDNVLLLVDFNGSMNCVGNGVVTCARILSTDHGGHLLMDHQLLKELESFGGLASLCGSQWRQDLHVATMADVPVKSGTFRYADVFGFYSDAFLLKSLRRHEEPAVYHIGSHDVGSLRSDK